MAYSELVKNFEKVRAYMREFYLYGFKSRTEYDAKSARSYDDERRRIESWLGDYMRFTQTAEGKNVFLSVDSRTITANPFYKAWKTESFTDGDITLHFILFDILSTPEAKKTLAELTEEIDARLAGFREPMTFDASTIRKKLKEYEAEGLIKTEKEGRHVLYSRMPEVDITGLTEALHFFSEVAPCGVIGSFLQDKLEEEQGIFSFKHHYITHAIDSDILARLFAAMQEKRCITVENLGRHSHVPGTLQLVPLKVYISAQNGRYNLLAFHEGSNRLNSYRLDYLTDIRPGEVYPQFDVLRAKLEQLEAHMWGVNCKWSLKHLERVEFEVQIGADEQHITRRLEREKRCGRVEKLDDCHYRFTAEVFDTNEMLPWIRTFLCRITRISFSNREVGQKFRDDLQRMYRIYGIDGGDTA